MSEYTEKFVEDMKKMAAAIEKRDTIKPSHYLHPTIPGLEARHVIENYPYHIATAIAYLWRCGRKEGVDPLDDLRKAKMHLGFELERINKVKQPAALLDYNHREMQRIIEVFPYNIASALYFLLGCLPLRTIISSAIICIDREIERLTRKDGLWEIFNK